MEQIDIQDGSFTIQKGDIVSYCDFLYMVEEIFTSTQGELLYRMFSEDEQIYLTVDDVEEVYRKVEKSRTTKVVQKNNSKDNIQEILKSIEGALIKQIDKHIELQNDIPTNLKVGDEVFVADYKTMIDRGGKVETMLDGKQQIVFSDNIFVSSMFKLIGKKFTISSIHNKAYVLEETPWVFSKEMLIKSK